MASPALDVPALGQRAVHKANAGFARDGASRADPLAACLSRYLHNLEALYRVDAALAARIDGLTFEHLPPLERARDGQFTLRLRADDGRTVYAHSRYHPLQEAEALAHSQRSPAPPAFLLHGLGLGYALLALEQRFDRPLLIVAENDLAVIKAALCANDLSLPLADRRVVFLTAADKAHVHDKLRAHATDLLLGLAFVASPHAARVHADFHRQVRAALADFMAYARLQMVTLLKTARVTFKNVAFNLPHYLANPGVEALQNRAVGYPAVVVAAGPSLARHVRRLRELRQRAVVIAVQTVFKLLRALDALPHFVTSLDYHEVSAEFFRGVEDFGDCMLVAEPKAAWHVLDLYRGPQRVLRHRFHDLLLREAAPARGSLPAGTTVAHLAFYLAQHLGCDPVIFVGQDLAFSEGLYYLPGMPIEQTWQPELGRFCTLEMKQWERIARNRPILRRVRDLHGREVYSDETLLSYAEQFAADFANARCRVIQASEGGLAIPGMEVMPLDQAVERFCRRPLPAGLFAAPSPTAAVRRERVVRELEERQRELQEVHAIAAEMGGLLDRLYGLLDRPSEFNRVMVRVDELRRGMQKFAAMYRLVVDVSALGELRRYSADRRLGTIEKETRQTARQRLARDREFVAAFTDGCEFLARVLPDALARVQERM